MTLKDPIKQRDYMREYKRRKARRLKELKGGLGYNEELMARDVEKTRAEKEAIEDEEENEAQDLLESTDSDEEEEKPQKAAKQEVKQKAKQEAPQVQLITTDTLILMKLDTIIEILTKGKA